MSGFRLGAGGLIDRTKSLGFSFNGRRLKGYEGDTLASALIANGVRMVGRSFKYHRPRGIMAAGVEEPNALVQLERGARTLPNQQATRVQLYGGLEAESINCWPGPEFDAMAIMGWFHRLIPAGFYYKTFMWPAPAWHLYEHFIRKAAGLGHAPAEPDPDHYDRMNAHCDVLVVGAGPAGIAAASAASRAGARVILADDQDRIGGWLLNERREIGGKPAALWLADAITELEGAPETRVLLKASAFGYYDHNFMGICQHLGPTQVDGAGRARQRIWRVRARQVVLATGAIERPLIFADNDRPGIMLAGAVRAYANRYGVAAGKRVCVFTNNDDAYRTAIDLKAAGVMVPAVVDLRADPDAELATQALAAGIEVVGGSAVTAVEGAREELDFEGRKAYVRHIDCDVVASSGGWNPAVHLHSHSGGKCRFEDARGIFLPDATLQACRSAGAANGTFTLDACLDEGLAAGKAAAQDAGAKKQSRKKAPTAEPETEAPARLLWVVPSARPIGRGAKHFLDQAHDVTVNDVQLAAREGYASIEHAKRYTTLGMAPDQGKTGNIQGMAVLGQALGVDNPGQIGTTTFRPPFTPVTIGALAGRDVGPLMDPVRMTPIHHWHELAACKWEDVGQWKRPWYYPKKGEDKEAAVARECTAVRGAVGIMDASTLGKIDIQGPDAATILNRVYTNAWGKLAIGACRYGLMLGEDGMIIDDGVTSRLGESHFLMTTTTGNAARVLEWLEEWLQTEWPELRVYCTSVTEQWATVTVCGPHARDLLSEFTDDIDLSRDAFPFMMWRQGHVAGIPARIFRVSFTGELSYEINVPASYGLSLWTALMNAGEKYGITPFGTETMHVLRAEKGYIIVGQETDGTVTPADVGMSWALSKKKDFLGRRSLARGDGQRDDRKQLVGLLPLDPGDVLPEGGQITAVKNIRLPVTEPAPMIGHVTSSYHSVTMGCAFALALVKGGRARHGDTVYVPLADKTVAATVTAPVFYDPDGEKLHG